MIGWASWALKGNSKMIKTMYRVEFLSNNGENRYGVVVFEMGRILGGDGACVYVGTYEIENGLLKVNVKVTNDCKALTPTFGEVNVFHLNGEAKVPNDEVLIKEFTVYGAMIENPARKMVVKFTRRA